MATTTNKNDLICSICGKIFTNPVLLSPCGHSFDRECISSYQICPIGRCGAIVFDAALLPNFSLKSIVAPHHESRTHYYELFLLDTSKSMWYSDWLIGLFGTGRFEIAIEFLTNMFEHRRNSPIHKISLVTFDTNPIEQFPFGTARQHHVQSLGDLKPTGEYTALFDAIKFCMEKFEMLNLETCSTSQCLYVMTDGGDNFSSSGNQQHYIDFIQRRGKRLSISGHIIQVGNKNVSSTKRLCERLNYGFHHFNDGNVAQFAKSFLASSNVRYASQNNEQTVRLIAELPDACATPVGSTVNHRRVPMFEYTIYNCQTFHLFFTFVFHFFKIKSTTKE